MILRLFGHCLTAAERNLESYSCFWHVTTGEGREPLEKASFTFCCL